MAAPCNLAENARRMELYQQGHSDREIADKVGVNHSSIRCWRRYRNLAPQVPVGGLRKLEPVDRPMTRDEVRMIAYGYHRCGQTPYELAREHARPVGMIRQVLDTWKEA